MSLLNSALPNAGVFEPYSLDRPVSTSPGYSSSWDDDEELTLADTIPDPDASVLDEVIRRRDEADVREFISGLTPRQRQIVELSYSSGQSMSNVARILEISPPAVHKTLKRVRLVGHGVLVHHVVDVQDREGY